MNRPTTPSNLEQTLDRLRCAEQQASGPVTIKEMLSHVGRRAFGPLLLVPGVITLLPIVGDIPGVPTVMAIWVLLIAGQLLFHNHHFWLPHWLLRRSVDPQKLLKAVKYMRPAARFIDRLLKTRLQSLTGRAGTYAIAVLCILIALAMPLMEVVPFTANGAGLALTLLGLSLMANDGLMALLAFVTTIATFVWVIQGLA